MPHETTATREPTSAPRRRARPLPVEERRAAVIAAARPLIEQQGMLVSTREIAEAAGVAEGTLFRVFRTKEEIVDAVVADALDPTRGVRRIEQIDRALPLERRLVRLVETMQDQIREITTLFLALRTRPRDEHHDKDRDRHAAEHAERNTILLTAIADLIGDDADRLRVSAADAAWIVSGWAFMSGHPMFSSETRDPADVVDLLLHGLAADPATPRTTPSREEGPAC